MKSNRLILSGERAVRIARTVIVVLLALLVCAVPTYSWFYVGRRAVAITPVSNPTALYISAANKEDISYLDLSGIDVTNGTYKDYVFCIRGNNVWNYMLQLAYTTNNQFTFEIYRAEMTTGSVPGSALGTVLYVPHDGTADQYYYIPNAASQVTGHFLNNRSGSDTLAKDNDAYHDDTYKDYTNTAYINQYAEPLYWHADSAINVPYEDMDDLNNFFHYYILRVRWSNEKQNDRETDIIYISARNSTS